MSVVDPMPHIFEFSSAYHLVEGMYVEPNEDIYVPRVQDHLYAYVQEQYYEMRATPITFRHSDAKYHFEVSPSENVRIDTIEMPFEMVTDMNLDRFPDEEHFLLAKPRHAHRLRQIGDVG